MKFFFLAFMAMLAAQCQEKQVSFVEANYDKIDTTIVMRDGIKLYTVIYVPKDKSEQYPFLVMRTPYSSGPYGFGQYKQRIGPDTALMHEKYIFVYQDVRGRYMSEGHNLEVTPYIPDKKTNKEVDESSDTWDTIDWLLKNIKNNNGRVGLYGISYPGFYASASLPGAHPAIKAVSPQAPVTDEFIGDDANHNGAFFLLDNFSFMNYFGKERNGPVENYGGPMFRMGTEDAYSFFLKMGTLKNTQSVEWFNHRSYIWNEYLQHDTYDTYWQARNIRTHLKNIQIPVMVVGGWFDAEDLFGALHIYKAIESQSPQNKNILVMGPWTHGAWASPNWSGFGPYFFGSNTSAYFRDSLQTRFFNFYLKDIGSFDPAEATVFETGTNTWRHFAQWPPRQMQPQSWFLGAAHSLSADPQVQQTGFDTYISDPANPVPYTGVKSADRNNEYMAEDERFASSRNDVIYFRTTPLQEDLTLAGPILANLQVSISTTDVDFVVKLIDEFPDTFSGDPGINPAKNKAMQGAQILVRAEVLRGKFRDNYTTPSPFVPGKITDVKINLNDVCHTFKKGHRIMVQIQSSWFPLVDRNPQRFMRIPDASEKDFQSSTIRIYHDALHQSSILLPVLPGNDK